MGAWTHGCVDAWVRGHMGAWTHGCVDTWVRGRMGTRRKLKRCTQVRKRESGISDGIIDGTSEGVDFHRARW